MRTPLDEPLAPLSPDSAAGGSRVGLILFSQPFMEKGKKHKDVSATMAEGTSSAGAEGHAVTETVSETATAVADATEKRGPVQSFRQDDVSVSIWSREHKGRVYYSCSFERSYVDGEHRRRWTRCLGQEDLGKVVALAKQANDYLHGLPDHDQD